MSNRLKNRRADLHQPLGSFEIFAHRGLEKNCAENTLEAFEHAVQAGAHWLETDVHATADGVVVVFHDHTLNRLLGISGDISSVKWADIKDLETIRGGKLATFESLLKTFPHMPVNVDMKNDGAAENIARVTVEADAQHRVRFASFSERRKKLAVKKAARLGAKVTSGATEPAVYLFYLCSRVSWRLWPLVRTLAAPWVSSFDAIQVPVNYDYGRFSVTVVNRKTVAAAHRFGIKVHVWTIDDEAEMHRLMDMGVDGIISNRTDLLAAVLRERQGLGAAS